MIVYLYRWKIKDNKDEQFRAGWEAVTLALRLQSGSLGSRLHKGSDAFTYGYAQWPDRETRTRAQPTGPEVTEGRRLMMDAIEVSYPEIELEPVADYLVSPKQPDPSAVPPCP